MMTIDQLNCIDRSLKEIKQSKKDFGGIVMILGGDFKQCPPVMKN
jgi:hypothetical protein